MCHAIPAKVIQLLADDRAIVSIGGIEKAISTTLIEEVKVGEYVIIHVGFALTKLNESEASKTLKLFDEMENLAE